MEEYDHEHIEEKWQKKWEQKNLYETPDNPDPANAQYVLGMFPYPSGSGLHVGHVESFAGTDVYARFQRMQDKDVLFPMGWDAFGLPAENYAIKTGTHPRERTDETIPIFKDQLNSLGLSYDWGREVNTSKPEYYQWTQWLFTTLFEQGLAEKKPDTVNWCPGCQTVLANAQVIDDLCERCDSEVEQKEMDQWFFNTTEYADELVDNLDDLDWPESTKELQRNWIGRQNGARFNFPVHDGVKRRYVILHGYKSGPDKHFHPWLKDKLEALGNEVIVPELPNADDPDISEQVAYVKENIELTEDTILVGHSLGTIVAMKLLENLDHSVRSTYLIAPYVDTDFADGKTRGYEDTTEWSFDMDAIHSSTGPLINVRPAEDTSISDAQYKRAENKLEGIWKTIDVSKPHAKGEKEPALLPLLSNEISVFTTRPDTLFGVTYIAAAPESTWVENLIEFPELGLENREAVKEYVQKSKKKTDQQRRETDEKTGVKLEGITVEHPASGEELPVYVADYVLPDYGTGKIMAVPAHDERDFQFAKTQDLPMRTVIEPDENISDEADVYTGEGKLINSDTFNGLESREAAEEITGQYGHAQKTYQLKDWSIGRQRYWGAPIPIVYDPEGNSHPVPDEHLPWELPDDVPFEPTGEPPLAKSEELQNRVEEIFGEGWTPETETMDTFVDSSWYFLRYPDAGNNKRFASKEALEDWCPVDMYIGGAEHAVLHLLYARFITKALADAGEIDFREPFSSLRHQGMVLAEDGTKMSKSKGNVVNPNDVVDRLGADTLRMYELFAGPFSESFDWDTDSIAGPRRFIERIWRLVHSQNPELLAVQMPPESATYMHQTVRKVTRDIADFKFNTAISKLMEARNEMQQSDGVADDSLSVFLRLLAPFAPHVTEELWGQYGGPGFVHAQDWPDYSEKAAESGSVEMAVQVDGEVRGQITVDKNAQESDIIDRAKGQKNVAKHLENKTITRSIFVPEQLVNFVTE
jgi:leucyl-tRNA synthetase